MKHKFPSDFTFTESQRSSFGINAVIEQSVVVSTLGEIFDGTANISLFISMAPFKRRFETNKVLVLMVLVTIFG